MISTKANKSRRRTVWANIILLALLTLLALAVPVFSYPQFTLSDGSVVTSDPNPTPWVNYSWGMVPLLEQTKIVDNLQEVSVQGNDWKIYNSSNGCLPGLENRYVIWCHNFENSDVRLGTGEYVFFTQAHDGYNPSQLYDITFFIDQGSPEPAAFKSVSGANYDVQEIGGQETIFVDADNFRIEIEAEEQSSVSWKNGVFIMPGTYDPVNPKLTSALLDAVSINPNENTVLDFDVQDMMFHSTPSSYTFYLDTLPPEMLKLFPEKDSFTGNKEPTIKADFKDSGVGISQVYMSVTTDSFSGEATCPGTSCVSPFSWDEQLGRIQFSGQDLHSGDITPVSVHVSATDVFGNTVSEDSSFTIDVNLPYVESLSLDDQFYDSSSDITYTSHNDSQITIVMNSKSRLHDFQLLSGTEVLIDSLSDFTSTDGIVFVGAISDEKRDGKYTLKFSGEKEIDSQSQTYGSTTEFENEIAVDTTPPEISDYVVTGGTGSTVEYGSPFSFSVNSQDEMLDIFTPVIKIISAPFDPQFIFNSEAAPSYSVSVNPVASWPPGLYDYPVGRYVFNVTSYDQLGNRRTEIFNFKINDTIAPRLTIYSPQYFITDGPSPTVRLNTSEPSSCTIYHDQGVEPTPDYLYRMSETFSSGIYHSKELTEDLLKLPAPGSYPYAVNCTDDHGNEAIKRFNLKWDSDIPTFSLELSQESPIMSLYDSVFMDVVASEGVICSSELFINSTEDDLPVLETLDDRWNYYYQMDLFGKYEFRNPQHVDITGDIVDNEEGNYTYFVMCRDFIGHLSLPVTSSFEVGDLSYMYVTDLSPSGWLNSSSVTIGVKTSRPGTCKYRESRTDPDDPNSWDEISETARVVHETELTGLSDGSHNYIISCTPSDPDYLSFYPEGQVIGFGVDTGIEKLSIKSILDSKGFNVSGSSTGDTDLTVTGYAEKNSELSVTVFKGSVQVWTNTTNLSDEEFYSLKVKLPESDGVYSFVSSIVDKAGNEAKTPLQNVSLDYSAPSTLDIYGLKDTRDTVYFKSQNFHLYATAHEEGNVVKALFWNESVLGSAVSDVISSCSDDLKGDKLSGSAGSDTIKVNDYHDFIYNYVDFANQGLPNFERFGVIATDSHGLFTDEITLNHKLLEDVTSSTSTYSCDSKYPTGWVDLELTLNPNTQTQLWFVAEDSVGNSNSPKGPYTFVVDTLPPSLQSATPSKGYIGADEFFSIDLELRDALSGIDEETVKLTLDGIVYNFTQLIFTGDKLSQFVSLPIPDGISLGEHQVVVSFSDLAGNSAVESYSFELDTNSTHEPEFDMVGDHVLGSVHYINQVSDLNVMLTYSEDDPKKIHITHVGLGDNLNDYFPDDEALSATELNDITFTVDLSPAFGSSNPAQPDEDTWYVLNVHSYKEISSELNSNEAKHHFTIRFDTQSPIITVNDNPFTTSESNVLIEGTCEDANMDSVTISGPDVIEEKSGLCTDGKYAIYVNLSAGQGEKSFTTTGVDKAGNSVQTESTITVDKDAPSMADVVIDSESHPNPDVFYSSTTVDVNWSSASDSHQVLGYSYILTQDRTVVPDDIIDSYVRHAEITNAFSGVNYFVLRSVDEAGNWGDSISRVVKVDNFKPTFGDIYTDPQESKSQSRIDIQVSDEHSGVSSVNIAVVDNDDVKLPATIQNVQPLAGYQWAFTISDFPEDTDGVFTVRINATDNSVPALSAIDDSTTVKFDNRKPIISNIVLEARTGQDTTIVQLDTDEKAYCRWSYSDLSYDNMPSENQFAGGEDDVEHSTVLLLNAGSNTYFFGCEDELGNDALTVSQDIVYDDVPPPLNEIAFHSTQYESNHINYTSSSSVRISGVSEVGATVESYVGPNFNSSVLVDSSVSGEVHIQAWQFVGGYNEEIHSVSMTNDSQFTLFSNDDADYTVYSDIPNHETIFVPAHSSTSFTMTQPGIYNLNVSMPGVGTSYLILSVAKQGSSFNIIQNLDENRVTFVSLLARDSVGNEEDKYFYQNHFIFKLFSDLISPEVTSASPNAVTTNNKRPKIFVNYDDFAGSGVNSDSSVLKINTKTAGTDISGQVISTADNFTFIPSEDIVSGDVGQVNLTIDFSDNVGHESSFDWNFTVNLNAPTEPVLGVTDSLPVDGVIYTRSSSPTVTLSFDEEVYLTDLRLNGALTSSTTTDDKVFTFIADSIIGINELSFSASPKMRNGDAGTYLLHYVVDTESPTLEIIGVFANSGVANQTQSGYLTNDNLTITISTNDANPSKVVLEGDVTSSETKIGTIDSTIELDTILDDFQGSHTVTITVYDKAGNPSVQSLDIVLDTIPPSWLRLDSVRSPTPYAYAPISGQASDDVDSIFMRSLGSLGYFDNVTLTRDDMSSGSILKYNSSVAVDNVAGESIFYVGSSQCGDTEFGSGWVQFGTDSKRYEIESCESGISVIIPHYGWASRVTVKGTIPKVYSAGEDVFNYNKKEPNGFFEQNLNIVEGWNRIEIFAKDKAENSIYYQVEVNRSNLPALYTLFVSIDSPLPSVIPLTSRNQNLVVSTTQAAVSCTASSAPPNTQDYPMIRDDDSHFHLNLDDLEDGTYRFTVDCDPVDDFLISQPDTVTFTVDATNPVVSILNRPSASQISQVEVELEWADTNADYLSFSGDVFPNPTIVPVTGSSGRQTEILYLSKQNSKNTITATLYDKGGLSGSVPFSIDWDTLSPSKLLFYPLPEAVNTQTILLSGETDSTTHHVDLYIYNEDGFKEIKTITDFEPPESDGVRFNLHDAAVIGDSVIFLNPDVSNSCSGWQDSWLQFKESYGESQKRYHVESCNLNRVQPWNSFLELTLTEPMDKSFDISTPVYRYSNQYPEGYFSIPVTLDSGKNMFYGIAYDKAGNEVHLENPVSIILDTENPLISDKYPIPLSIIGTEDITISALLDGTGSTPRVDSFALDGNELSSQSLTFTEIGADKYRLSAKATVEDERLDHSVSIAARDLAGNPAIGNWQFTADPTLPSGLVFDVANGFEGPSNNEWFFSGSDMGITWAYKTPNVNLSLVSYQESELGSPNPPVENTLIEGVDYLRTSETAFYYSSTPTDGTYKLKLVARKLLDDTGTVGPSRTDTLTIHVDNVAPQITSYPSDSIVDEPTFVAYLTTDEDALCRYSLDNSADAVSSDSGSSDSVSSDIVPYDQMTPMQDSGTTQHSSMITLSAGMNHIHFLCADYAGNKADTPTTVSIDYDADYPVLTVNELTDGMLTNKRVWDFTGTSEAFSTVELFINNVRIESKALDENEEFSFNDVALNDAGNNIYFLATDKVGRKSELRYSVFYDGSEPVLELIRPLPLSVHGPNNLQVQVKYSDNDILDLDSIKLEIDGSTVYQSQSPQSYFENGVVSYTNSYSEGDHEIKAIAKDRVGNSVEKTWTFTINANVPSQPKFTVEGFSPLGDSGSKFVLNTKSFDFKVEFQEPVEIREFSNSISGSYWLIDETGANGVSSANGDGNSVFTYRAQLDAIIPWSEIEFEARLAGVEDAVWEKVGPISFAGDFTKPSVQVYAPSITNLATPTLTFNWWDDFLKEIDLSGDVAWHGEFPSFSSSSGSSGSFNLNVTLMKPDDSNTINVRAIDYAGNEFNTSVEIVWDNTPPDTLNLFTLPSTYNQKELIVAGVTNTDVDKVSVYVYRSDTVGDISNSSVVYGNDISGTSALLGPVTVREQLAPDELKLSDESCTTIVNRYLQQGEFNPLVGRWRITDCHERGIVDKSIDVTLDTSVDTVTQGTVLEYYDSPFPTGYFQTKVSLEEGMNYIFADAVDAAGSSTETDDFSIVRVDSYPPSFSGLQPPLDAVLNGDGLKISALVDTTGTAIGSSKLWLDDNEVIPTTTSEELPYHYTLSYLPSTLAEGEHHVFAQASDEAQNTNGVSWSFTVDNSAPSMVIFSVANGFSYGDNSQWYLSEQNAEITMTFAADEEIEIQSLLFDGVPVSATKINNHQFTLSSQVSDGSHTMVLSAAKKVNQGLGITATYTMKLDVDSTPPEILSLSPREISTDTNPIEFTILLNEPSVCRYEKSAVQKTDVSTVASFADMKNFTTNGDVKNTLIVDAIQGSEFYYFRCADLSGNEASDVESALVTFDNSAPPLNVIYDPSENLISECSLSVSGTSEYGATVTLEVLGYEPKTYTITDKTDFDVAIDGGRFDSGTLIVPEQSTVTLSNLDPWAAYSITEKDGKLLESNVVSGGQTSYAITSGTFTLELGLQGSQGQSTPLDTLTITTSERPNTFNFDSVELRYKSPNENAIRLSAEDESGNKITTDYRYVVCDEFPPNVTLISPSQNTANRRPTIEFEVKDEYSLDETTLRAWIGINETLKEITGSLSFDSDTGIATYVPQTDLIPAELEESPVILKVYVEDEIGNAFDGFLTFTIDDSAPRILSSPEEKHFNTTLPRLTVEFEEPVTILDFEVDNAVDLINSTRNDTSATFVPQLPLSEGTHTFFVRAIRADGSGKIGPDGTYNFYVDLTPPTFTIDPLENPSNNQTMHVVIRADEAIDLVRFNGDLAVSGYYNSGGMQTPEFSALMNYGEGLKTIHVSVTDLAGNPSDVVSASTVYDLTGPSAYEINITGNLTPFSTIKFVYNESVHMNDSALQSPTNGSLYELTTVSDSGNIIELRTPYLSNGHYYVAISVLDSLGNQNIEDKVFSVFTPALEIALENPMHGVSPKPFFNATFTTNRSAQCKYNYGAYLSYEALPHYLIGNGLNHTLENISLTEGEAKNIWVGCKDENNQYSLIQLFTLTYDSSIPWVMRLEADPATITTQTFENGQWLQVTNISVITNEPTVCKLDNVTNAYVNMSRTFDGYNRFDESAFKTEHNVRLSDLSQDVSSYSYNVVCENLAGLLSVPSIIPFNVNLYVALQIDPLYPVDNYETNIGRLYLNISTNKPGSICTFKLDDGTSISMVPSMGGRIHSRMISGLSSGKHSIDYHCTYSAEEADLKVDFTIDNTAPTTPVVEPQNFTCMLSELYARWNSDEDLTDIVKYEYAIGTRSGFTDVRNYTSVVKRKSSVLAEGLDLTDKTTYYWSVKAKNSVGLWSQPGYGSILVDTSDPRCSEQVPPVVTVTETVVKTGLQVKIECEDADSGCNPDGLFYGVSLPGIDCIAFNNYVEPINIDQDSQLCWQAEDIAGNTNSGSKNITISTYYSDSDNDGVPDQYDNCKEDFNPPQLDTDLDGIGDACDTGDESESTLCSSSDLDHDGEHDDIDDDIDGDGLKNWLDPDDDNDGLCDTKESPLNNVNCTGEDLDDDEDGCLDVDEIDSDNDLDNNGIINEDDGDDDGDGLNDTVDVDTDNDGDKNWVDDDDDNDGIEDIDDLGSGGSDSTCTYDSSDVSTVHCRDGDDIDGDGVENCKDDDIDGDGLKNWEDSDDDNDGIPDAYDIDDNNNGVADSVEIDCDNDLDNDGTINELDDDDDGDGIKDTVDTDDDNDGIPDQYDSDDDNDGIIDDDEILDSDGDGMPDKWEMAHGLNPYVDDSQVDSDSDLLVNIDEYHEDTDPRLEDTDGDGFGDGTELADNFDPLDPEDYPHSNILTLLLLIVAIIVILGSGSYVGVTQYKKKKKARSHPIPTAVPMRSAQPKRVLTKRSPSDSRSRDSIKPLKQIKRQLTPAEKKKLELQKKREASKAKERLKVFDRFSDGKKRDIDFIEEVKSPKAKPKPKKQEDWVPVGSLLKKKGSDFDKLTSLISDRGLEKHVKKAIKLPQKTSKKDVFKELDSRLDHSKLGEDVFKSLDKVSKIKEPEKKQKKISKLLSDLEAMEGDQKDNANIIKDLKKVSKASKK